MDQIRNTIIEQQQLIKRPSAKTICFILVLGHMIWTLAKEQTTLSQRFLGEYQHNLNEEQDQQLIYSQLNQEEKEWLGISQEDEDEEDDREQDEEEDRPHQGRRQRQGQAVGGPGRPRPKYYELRDQIQQMTLVPNGKNGTQKNSMSAYSRATVIQQAAHWFPKRKQCRETCCVETIAISLNQDATKPINTEDGRDLADLKIQHFASGPRPHLKYFGTQLHPEMIPCLVPGTIIWIENHGKAERYFWKVLRPQIKVPFTLVVSGADGSSPSAFAAEQIMVDKLLQKFVATNPNWPSFMKNGTRAYPRYTNEQRQAVAAKVVPMNLGLSRQHAQEKHLLPYLHLTNYTNPFVDFRERFNLTKYPLDFHKDVFVHFGLHKPERQRLWNILCTSNNNQQEQQQNKTTTDNSVVDASCNKETKRLPVHDIYTSMSHYRFGISPPGVGYDCYRTYEMLLLGIIPIVEELDPEGYDLLEGLPVIHIPKMTSGAITNQQDFVNAIEQYIEKSTTSDSANNNFEKGWEKLFLKYRRRQLLKDTGRERDILIDPDDDDGREYYQGFRYTTRGEASEAAVGDIFCNKAGSCEVPSPVVAEGDPPNNKDHPTASSEEDRQWLARWEQEGSTTTSLLFKGKQQQQQQQKSGRV